MKYLTRSVNGQLMRQEEIDSEKNIGCCKVGQPCDGHKMALATPNKTVYSADVTIAGARKGEYVNERGFAVYDSFLTDYGALVRFQRSSSAMRPRMWMFLDNDSSIIHHDVGHVSVHMSPIQVRRAITAMQKFLATVKEQGWNPSDIAGHNDEGFEPLNLFATEDDAGPMMPHDFADIREAAFRLEGDADLSERLYEIAKKHGGLDPQGVRDIRKV